MPTAGFVFGFVVPPYHSQFEMKNVWTEKIFNNPGKPEVFSKWSKVCFLYREIECTV